MNDAKRPTAERGRPDTHHGHGLMMMMCISMLVIAVVLVATGVASPGIMVGAAMCAVMMAFMIWGMSHGKP